MTINGGVQLFSGFLNPGAPAPEVGVWNIHRQLRERLHDTRDYWVSCDPWNADVKSQVIKMLAHKPEIIIAIVHSYGEGRAFRDWAWWLNYFGREVDHVASIDGVPRYDKWYHAYPLMTWRSLWGSELLVMPDNVKSVSVYHTLNRSSWVSPHGRDVQARDDLVVRRRVVFGNGGIKQGCWPPGKVIIDPRVTHGTIDNDERVQAWCLEDAYSVLGVDDAAA